METCTLEVRNITKTFPGVMALNNVSMQFRAGEVHALLGENGAGKSTLIKILSGVYTPTSGEIYMDGVKQPHLTVKHAMQLGIAAIHQELNLVPELSIAENIYLGKETTDKLGVVNSKAMNAQTAELLNRFKIDLDPGTKVRELSVAKQQIVEIAKALESNARVLIFDEPTDVLTDKETVLLFNIIRELKKQNKALIYISHRLEELPEICDTFSVLRDGNYVGSGKISDCSKDDIIKLMIGRDLKEQFPYEASHAGDTVMALRGCQRKNFGLPVDLELHRGEVLGLYGLVGSGRSELIRAVIGLEKLESGTVELEGKTVAINSVAKAHKLGIYYSTEDRKRDGIINGMGVDFNMILSSLNRAMVGPVINAAKEKKLCSEAAKDFSVKTASLKTEIQTLSGGNQQKALLAKALLTNPKVLILDEPTRGIDVGTKADIYEIIDQLKSRGVGIIVISSELPEIMGISDKIKVFHDGGVTGEFYHTEFEEQAITQCAFGTKREVALV